MLRYYIVVAPIVRTLFVLTVSRIFDTETSVNTWIISIIISGTILNFICNSSIGKALVTIENLSVAVTIIPVILYYGGVGGGQIFQTTMLSIFLAVEANSRLALINGTKIQSFIVSVSMNILAILFVFSTDSYHVSILAITGAVFSIYSFCDLRLEGFKQSLRKSYGSILLGATGQASLYMIAKVLADLTAPNNQTTGYYITLASIGLSALIQRVSISYYTEYEPQSTRRDVVILAVCCVFSIISTLALPDKVTYLAVIPTYGILSVLGYRAYLLGTNQNLTGRLANISALSAFLLVTAILVSYSTNDPSYLWLTTLAPTLRNYMWKRLLAHRSV